MRSVHCYGLISLSLGRRAVDFWLTRHDWRMAKKTLTQLRCAGLLASRFRGAVECPTYGKQSDENCRRAWRSDGSNRRWNLASQKPEKPASPFHRLSRDQDRLVAESRVLRRDAFGMLTKVQLQGRDRSATRVLAPRQPTRLPQPSVPVR